MNNLSGLLSAAEFIIDPIKRIMLRLTDYEFYTEPTPYCIKPIIPIHIVETWGIHHA